jgi:molybdate transport system substrate-binding protein
MKTLRLLFAVVIAALAVSFSLSAATVTVFAAASLTDSLKEIADGYMRQTGDKIVFNFSGSGTLARQIEEGAPADIYFSADEAKMDMVEKKDLIVKATRRSRLANVLVVVTPVDSRLAIASAKDLTLAGVKRLAIGDPKTVPAGTYARTYLTKLELWGGLERKIIPCESVRAVLAAVESGNVDAGIVYRTDAAMSKKVKVAFEVLGDEGPAINYPVALVRDTKQPVAARKLLEHLAGNDAGKVFEKHGFILLSEESGK